MNTIKRLTISNTGNLEFPPDMLAAIGLQAGDELVVIPTEDGFFIGSREKVMDYLLETSDGTWQEGELTIETFLSRRPQIAEKLLQKHYGLTSSDLST